MTSNKAREYSTTSMTTNSLLLAIAITAIANAQFTENSEENEQEILASVVVEADGSVEDYVDPILDGSTIRRLPAHTQRAVIGNLFYPDGSSEAYYYPTIDADQTNRRLYENYQHSWNTMSDYVVGDYYKDPKEDIVKMAYAAYCDKSALENWSCQWCQELDGYDSVTAVSHIEHNGKYAWNHAGIALSTTDFISHWSGFYSWTGDVQTQHKGYVAYNHDLNTIVVALSVLNSASLGEYGWMDNIESDLTYYPGATVAGACVHPTYLAWWNGQMTTTKKHIHNLVVDPSFIGFKAGLMPAIKGLISDHYKANIIVTGHGLGAAVAMFAMLDIYKFLFDFAGEGSFGGDETKIISYTFGEPKWCNKEMSEYFKQLFGVWTDSTLDGKHRNGVHFRVSYGNDLVSALSPASDYVHVNQGVLLNKDGSDPNYHASESVIFCLNGEADDNCKPTGETRWAIMDHNAYWNLKTQGPMCHAMTE